MRISYYRENKEDEPIIISIKEAKKLLKSNGGEAWIEHYDRDGGLFEVTPILLNSNNSKHKYNHHL